MKKRIGFLINDPHSAITISAMVKLKIVVDWLENRYDEHNNK